jgi:hypothetical protein
MSEPALHSNIVFLDFSICQSSKTSEYVIWEDGKTRYGSGGCDGVEILCVGGRAILRPTIDYWEYCHYEYGI